MTQTLHHTTQTLHHTTRTAVLRHARRMDCRAQISDELVTVYDERRGNAIVVEVRRDDDGRWVISWLDESASRYLGYSPAGARAMGRSYRHTVGLSLRQLRGLGVPSYPTPAAALATVEI